MTAYTTITTKVITHVLTLCLTILCIIGFPIFLLLVVCPILVIRFIVANTRKILRPGAGHILSPLSAFFAADRMHEPHPVSTFLINIVVEGLVDIPKFRTALVENVLKKKNKKNENLLANPELQCYVTRYGGFFFWEWDKSFDINNHFKVVTFPGKSETDEITEDLWIPWEKNLLRMPYEEKRSPWELYILHNYKEKSDTSNTPKTLLTFRLHHAICGGYSSMGLVLDHAGVTVNRATPLFPHVPFWKKVFWYILYFIRAPYELILNTIEAFDFNDWKLPVKKLTKEKSAAQSPPLSVDYIKGIKNAHKTSFSSIISAAIAGGVRNYMLANNIRVPPSIHVMTPWPVKNIPEKLGNFLTGVIIEYPIGIRDPVKRMQKIQRNFLSMKYSTLPFTNFHMLKIMGRLFVCMLKPARNKVMATTIMSNIAGPDKEHIYLGHPVRDMSFVANFMTENVGIGFTVLSYNKHLRIVCGADTTILPNDKKADELMEKIVEEMEILKSEAIV